MPRRVYEPRLVRAQLGGSRRSVHALAFLADPSHPVLEGRGIFAPAPRVPDFLAQAFPIGVALLQGGLHFAPLRIDREHVVDHRLLIAAPRGEPAFDNVGLFANEPDVEQGPRDFPPRARIISSWTTSNSSVSRSAWPASPASIYT